MTELVVMLLYFGAMFAIGLYFKGRIKDTDDFYLSGRSLPAPVVMLTMAATYLGAAATQAKSGLAYRVGFAAITVTIVCVIAMGIFAFISPKIRRMGAKYKIQSIPDLFYKRYGRTTSVVAAVIVAWTLIGVVGSQMVATTTILQVICSQWAMSYETAAIISVVVMVGYTMLSGLYGVAYTDVVQALLLIGGVGIALPIMAISDAGGWGAMTAQLPAEYWSFKPDMTIFGYMWVYLFYFISGPPYWQRALAAGSEKGVKYGTLTAAGVILWYTFMVTFIGMAGKLLYPTFPQGVSYEALIPMMVRQYFHPLFSAITMVAIMAALMSTIDSYLIAAAQSVVTDIYKPFRKEPLSQEQEVKYAKYIVVVVGVMAVIFTFNIRIIMDAIIFSMTFYSSALAVPSLAALYWRKATKEGILSSMMTGVAVAIIWTKMGSPWKLQAAIPAGILSIIVLIVVCLATYKENSKDNIYLEDPGPESNAPKGAAV